MKNFFGVLKYVKGYWRYGTLNITFNILQVFFGLFSIMSVIPLINVLFLSGREVFQKTLAAGEPVIGFSINKAIDWVTWKMSAFVIATGDIDAGRMKVLLWICIGLTTMI